MLARLALLALLVGPSLANADQRELYTSLEVAPYVLNLKDPISERSTTTALAPGASLSVAYGITNTIHVGAALHFSMASNATFKSAQIVLSDGTPSTGTLYENVTVMGGSAFALYRFDTGTRLSPLVQADVGVASLSYSNILYVPSSASYGVGSPNITEFVLELRASARAEYRFGDHLVAGVGAGIVVSPGALRPWAIYFPINVGWIW